MPMGGSATALPYEKSSQLGIFRPPARTIGGRHLVRGLVNGVSKDDDLVPGQRGAAEKISEASPEILHPLFRGVRPLAPRRPHLKREPSIGGAGNSSPPRKPVVRREEKKVDISAQSRKLVARHGELTQSRHRSNGRGKTTAAMG